MSRSGTATIQWIIAGVLISAFFGLLFVLLRPKPVPSQEETPDPAEVPAIEFPLPPVSSSPFLNTKRGKYVGNQACVDCHGKEHGSFLLTAHSRALGDIDLQNEPPNAAFEHEKSRRTYAVYRKDDQLWHKESMRLKDGSELVLGDHPMRYVIGSGHHSRSYIVEDDGFLVESPITWYASRNAWGMSPGYDIQADIGFERATDLGCISCHAGRVETIDGSYHRLKILESSIGCESCHGPGSLHVEARLQSDKPAEGPDDGIVNPRRLSRDLQEAICSQCHLRGEATVFLRGKQFSDFRPGLPLHDFRIDYSLKKPDKSMKVTGHVQQMHLSRCYQHSATMTCTTCHNPHDSPSAEEKLLHYKNACLTCHNREHCGLKIEERLQKNPQDNCVSCHMPQVPTDIPHFAFTHHRIAVHDSEPEEFDDRQIGALVAFQETSHLSEIDQQRGLGLAYLELSDGQSNPRSGEAYRQRALELLEEVYQSGMHEAEVTAELARIYWIMESPRAVEFAESALQSDNLLPRMRVNSLYVLADSYYDRMQTGRAVETLTQLVRLRRHSEDWLLLGLCREQNGNLREAVRALKRAESINPSRPEIHEILTHLSRKLGDPRLEMEHRRKSALFAEPR